MKHLVGLTTCFVLYLGTSLVKPEASIKFLEVCNQYSFNSTLYPLQYCAAYCCGTCDERSCCSILLDRLDQTKCGDTDVQTTTRKTQYSSSPSIFMWTFGVLGTILVMCGVASCLKYRANQYRMAQGVQAMSSMPPNTPRNGRPPEQITVGTNEDYQYDMRTIYNTNFQNDLPPPYESIKVQPKQPNIPDEGDKQDTPV